MAVNRKASKPEGIINENTLAQIFAALKSLLTTHEGQICEAIDEAENHRLVINLPLTLDCSESAPKIDMDMRFVPKTITDSRTILVTDPWQNEFDCLTPAQLKGRQEEFKASKKREEAAAAEAEAAAAAAENGGEVPKAEKKGRGKKSKAGVAQ